MSFLRGGMQELTNDYLTFSNPQEKLLRRVQGDFDFRLHGVGDILLYARGASVLDVGSNRGRVCDEFARNGAVRVMGLDNYEDGVIASRHLFCDYRTVEHRFEVVDLSKGPAEIRKVLGKDADLKHDITLLLAIVHKLKRVMVANKLTELLTFFAEHTNRFIVWRGYIDELPTLDGIFGRSGFERVQTSTLAQQPSAIWAR